jgi:murein DD-endopeptidase MepM/ murein hydrolase activator NlpD
MGAFVLGGCTTPPFTPTPQPATPTVLQTKTSPPPTLTLSPSPTLVPTITLSPSLSPSESSSPTPVPFKLCSPLGGYTFEELTNIESQAFTPNRPGKDDGHQGVDFAHWRYKDLFTLEDAPIQSVLPGVVAASILDKYPYGNMIILETKYDHLPENLISLYQLKPNQSLYLLYAHLKNAPLFLSGQMVTCGENLGLVGSTGASGNAHLHFETRTGESGIRFQSMEYYQTTSTEEERANYERWRFSGEFNLFDPWLLLGLGS